MNTHRQEEGGGGRRLEPRENDFLSVIAELNT